MNIKLTDIFGKDINDNNDVPVILMHINDPIAQLKLIYRNVKNGSFWEVKESILNNLFIENSINPSFFTTVGTIWFNTVSPKKTIYPLINIQNDTHAQNILNYIKIGNINNIPVWKPVDDSFKSLGCILSKKRPDYGIACINDNLLKQYTGSFYKYNDTLNLNEFNLFGIDKKCSAITIDRIKYLNMYGDQHGYIKSLTNHFISRNINGLILKNNDKQSINLSKRGELMISGLCIEEQFPKSKFVKLSKQSNTSKQKWIPYYHFIKNGSYLISFISNDSGRALYFDQNTRKICTSLPTSKTKWIFIEEEDETDVLDNESWITQVHNNIALTVPEKPWFKNRQKTPVAKKPFNFSQINYSVITDTNNEFDILEENDYFWFWIKLILSLIILFTILSIVYHLYHR